MVKKYQTKDSGQRTKYSSGMNRDLQTDKPRFDLITPLGMPYEETLFYRWAMLMNRGAIKYGIRNWEKANGIDEFNDFKASLWRHFFQFMSGENDEDHMSAICFNLNGLCYLMWKLNIDINGNKRDDKNASGKN